MKLRVATLAICLFLFNALAHSQNPTKKTNVIFILADDLGYGDVSCYGQKKFETPNIDKLAGDGMLFTQHYAGSSVCAPSRSSLMTGEHTGHTYVRGNKEAKPEGQLPLLGKYVTMAEMFKEAGYKTGAFGKWGLGYPNSEGDPIAQGFDVFYGFNCQRNAHHYYPWHLYDNNKKVILEKNKGAGQGTYAPDLIHERALSFLDENKDKPFFMYYPNVLPHAEMFAPEEYMKKFRGKYLPEKEYKGASSDDKWFKRGRYGSQPEGHAAFAAMISLLDDQVGDIVKKLEELGIADNTIIVFTSDNGPHQEAGADPKYFDSNGVLRGFKRDLYEGGIRVPMIVKWPAKVKAGSKSGHISAFWDFLPTFADVAGVRAPKKIDGISMLPTLTGEEKQKEHKHLYWEFHEKGGRQAVRMGRWKGVRYGVKKNPDAPIQLFDLENDPGEKNNIAEENPKVVRKIAKLMKKSRTESAVFKF